MSGYSKEQQLARGERRYRRKIASPKQWQAIWEAKRGPCRVCGQSNAIQLHHLLARSARGDDVPANIVPLCPDCHEKIERGDLPATFTLARSLTPEEYAYLVEGKR